MESMLDEVEYCKNVIKKGKMSIMPEEKKEEFSIADKCHICNKKIY